MVATFSIAHLLAIASVSVLLVVNAPVVFGGITSIEVGKYRVAWTRYGWSYQYDWRNAGKYTVVALPDGTTTDKSLSKTVTGFWPWYGR